LAGGSFGESRGYSGSVFGYLCVRFYNSLMGVCKSLMYWYIQRILCNLDLLCRLWNCFLWAICETVLYANMFYKLFCFCRFFEKKKVSATSEDNSCTKFSFMAHLVRTKPCPWSTWLENSTPSYPLKPCLVR
jgi:hypothetical protein